MPTLGSNEDDLATDTPTIRLPVGALAHALDDLAGPSVFHAVWQATSDAMALSDPNGIVLAANPAYLDLYGYGEAEVVGHSFAIIFPEAQRADAEAQYRAVFVDPEPPRHYHSRVRRRDGSERDVEAQANFIMVDETRVALVSTIRDITEQRHAEHARWSSESQFRMAFTHAPVGMALVGLDGSLLQVNSALCRFTGYDEAELLALGFQDITHPDDLAAELVLADELLRGERVSFELEKRYVRKDGTVVWGLLTGAVARDEDGAPLHLIGQVQDVTERTVADERFRVLVEHLPVVVALNAVDATASTLYVSPRSEAILGYPPDRYIADPDLWLDQVHPDDRDRVLRVIAETNETGETLRVEYRMLHPDGRWRWLEDESQLVYDERGSPMYWLTIQIDVTDRRQREEELRAAKEAAEEANRLKSAFFSTMTHELRTPLTAVIGYTSLLERSLKARGMVVEAADAAQILRSSDHLLALISDVLDLSRIQAGGLDLFPERVNLAAVTAGVVADLAPQAAVKRIGIVDESTPGLEVVADPLRLRQVLFNLVGNAVKFTEHGFVTVASRATGDGVEIVVTDTGIGIAPDVLPHIFNEFRQADGSTTRKYGGSGLGLAISRKLVELHGGTIRVESEPGAGSVFTVVLPAT